jgi:8-oxo-dGTP diphosphatase
MKFEFSAGGVVYKHEQRNILILLAQHSGHHGWVFPKGLIGDHSSTGSNHRETKEDAAIREVQEETGAIAKIVHPLTQLIFWYQWQGEKIKKTVYYYVMQYISGDIAKHDWEMENVEWLPIDQVEDRLTFQGDKKVWREAKEYITKTRNPKH